MAHMVERLLCQNSHEKRTSTLVSMRITVRKSCCCLHTINIYALLELTLRAVYLVHKKTKE